MFKGFILVDVNALVYPVALPLARQCPLRIHNYHPDSLFSFMHKSLQEYLVGNPALKPLFCLLQKDETL